jgi:hypothetical protein
MAFPAMGARPLHQVGSLARMATAGRADNTWCAARCNQDAMAYDHAGVDF